MSKWCFVSAMLIGVVACSDDDSIDTSLYSGTDISSYATIKADKESKKTNIEILKEGEWKVYGGENSNSILFDEGNGGIEHGEISALLFGMGRWS